MTRYTEPEKAQAVGLALVAGPKRAAQTTGIPMSTIRGWRDSEEFLELQKQSRNDVAATFWAAIQVGLDEVVTGMKADAPLRDKSIALGILYDKFALLTGQATTRSESFRFGGSSEADPVDQERIDQLRAVLADAYIVAKSQGTDIADEGEQRRIARDLIDAEIERRADEAEG